ncbi:hypothetical protein BpHYR1_012277 [Brachionus plicatilis]|uniref:Uncharacterized protein n=1 Tax=Brachionus plicatilis TaxID=10195 RepID=A0A3M7PP64_BRAPC|nr:hypothetical protein BpHYR1_012277 [Brachionus plicatilis]
MARIYTKILSSQVVKRNINNHKKAIGIFHATQDFFNLVAVLFMDYALYPYRFWSMLLSLVISIANKLLILFL